MSSFEDHANVLAGVELEDDYPQVEEALEAAQEALTFAQSLSDTFERNGANMPTEVHVADLENLFDAHMSELRAAAVLLADYPDSVERSNIIHKELLAAIEGGETNCDPRTAEGFSKLARRVELVRLELTKLSDTLKELMD